MGLGAPLQLKGQVLEGIQVLTNANPIVLGICSNFLDSFGPSAKTKEGPQVGTERSVNKVGL